MHLLWPLPIFAWLSGSACLSCLIESKRIVNYLFFPQTEAYPEVAGGKFTCIYEWDCICVSVWLCQWIFWIISFSFPSRSTLWSWDDRVICHLSSLPSPGVKIGQGVRGFKPCASCLSMTQLSFKHSCFWWEPLSSPLLPGLFQIRYLSHMHFWE